MAAESANARYASPGGIWSFHSAGQIIFGCHSSRQLPQIVQRRGCQRVLLVTDEILLRTGILEPLQKSLRDHGVDFAIFPEGEPEPSMVKVLACAEQARQSKAEMLIAVGGGSNMDLAKIAATLLAHGGHPRDYIGDGNIPGPIAPLICLPTTAGTGSEVSFAAVLTDTEKKVKVGILSNHLRPEVALVDPMLTVSCPPRVTADSGIDALTHAIEAYTAVDNAIFPAPEGGTVYQGKHPLGDVLAEQAIILAGKHLRRAVAQGDDLQAREGMSLSALLAGLAFSNVGVAAVHALEYPLGGKTGYSHGAVNGLLLPYVMKFNLPARTAEFSKISQLLGEDTSNMNTHSSAERAIFAVERLRADIGIPARLGDIGVKSEQIPMFAEQASAVRRVLRVNPRPLTVGEIEGIYKSAY